MIYDIFISLGIIAWVFSGIVFGALTADEPSHHAEGPAIVMILFFIYFCAMLGPFSGSLKLLRQSLKNNGI